MSSIKEVFIFNVLFVSVSSFRSNCDPFNQFKFYCFPIEDCYMRNCQQSQCGVYTALSDLVKIKSTRIIPKCAFTNADSLRRIYGVDSGIEIIASGAFANLTNLKDINLSLNSIRELHVGIFDNVSATSLDLSWNKLAYIQQGAFQGLYNLKSLNLSRNELSVFPIHQMPMQLSEINLSYNLFDRMILTSGGIPKLTDIDLSFNKIDKLALLFEHPVTKIDLTGNELKKFDYIEIFSCAELRIAQNRFSEVPENLPFINLKRIALYPNPWKCDELRKLWIQLQNNFIKILGMSDNQPVCGFSRDSTTNLVFARLTSAAICKEDSDCAEDRICRTNKCLDPCREGLCGSPSVCRVNKHRLECTCPEDLKRDPADPSSPCQNVQCFVHADCPPNFYCYRDNKCKFDRNIGKGDSSNGLVITEVSDEPWWGYEIYRYGKRPVHNMYHTD